jgi:hypothetical protein
MTITFQTIKATDFDKIIRKRPFIALPREEIDRLYGSIEVHPVNMNGCANNYETIRLFLFVAAHYNYSWITIRNKNDNTFSLGFSSPLLSSYNGDIFLDESIITEAQKIFNDNVRVNCQFDIKMSGLLYQESIESGSPRLGVSCVCRLRQSNQVALAHEAYEIVTMSNGELIQKQSQFDSRSKIIIDHIDAV